MLWALLNSITCRVAIGVSKVRDDVALNEIEKVRHGLVQLWGLEPTEDQSCSSCELEHGWISGGPSMPNRVFEAVDSCDGSQTYPVVHPALLIVHLSGKNERERSVTEVEGEEERGKG